MGERYDKLLERAALLPVFQTGVAGSVIAQKAQGSKVYDLDNIGYIDYLGGGGASIVGFANPFVHDAVKKALEHGVPDGFHIPREVELAERLKRVLPWVGALCFCRNQDEAMREALAWARRARGRNEIAVLEGGARLRIGAGQGAGGYDGSVQEIAGWDVDRIVETVREMASRIAAVVVEPLMSRMGLIPLMPDAVNKIAETCHETEVLLVLDERTSGFRVTRGGAAAWAGVTPDAAVYGSALGGGFPIGVAAFSERRGDSAPDGDEIRATPHPVSLAAAEAVLSILENDTTYERLEERTAQLTDGILNLVDRYNRPMTINRVGSVFALYVGVEEVGCGEHATRADKKTSRRIVNGLRDEHILLPSAPGGTAFVSSAHGAKDIEETLSAFEKVLLRLHQEDLP